MTLLNYKVRSVLTAVLFGFFSTGYCASLEEPSGMHLAKKCLNYVLWNAQLATFSEADITISDDRDGTEASLLSQLKSTKSAIACHQLISGSLTQEKFYEIMWHLAKDGDTGAAKVLWNHGKFRHITDVTSEAFEEVDLMAVSSDCIPAQYQACYAVAHADMFMADKRVRLQDMFERGNSIAGALLKLSNGEIDHIPSFSEIDEVEPKFLDLWRMRKQVIDFKDIDTRFLSLTIAEYIGKAIGGSRCARDTLFNLSFSFNGKEYTKGLLELHLDLKDRSSDFEAIR